MVSVSNHFSFICREEFTNPDTGKYFKINEIIKRTKFANTLREIGQNGTSDIFYHGEMGEQLVKEVKDLRGIITMKDFKNYK